MLVFKTVKYIFVLNCCMIIKGEMHMRVIAGKAKRRKLIAPEGLHTRPITDRIKEALFSMWQFEIADSYFLDLFSGSGSMGIEALSRGAKKVVMVDNDNNAIKVIKENIKNCKLDEGNETILKEDVFSYIGRSKEQFDIIYVDPPFTVDSIFDPVMQALAESDLLKKDGFIALRTEEAKKMKDNYGKLVKYKEKKYGISMIHFYKVNDL